MISVRKFIGALSTLPIYLIAQSQVFADPITGANNENVRLCPGGIGGVVCNTPSEGLEGLVGTVLTYLFIAAAIIAIIFLIWGGIKWITSGGDKTKVEAARHTIVGAIIGLVIVFASFFIITTILNTFFGVDIKAINLPTLTQ